MTLYLVESDPENGTEFERISREEESDYITKEWLQSQDPDSVIFVMCVCSPPASLEEKASRTLYLQQLVPEFDPIQHEGDINFVLVRGPVAKILELSSQTWVTQIVRDQPFVMTSNTVQQREPVRD